MFKNHCFRAQIVELWRVSRKSTLLILVSLEHVLTGTVLWPRKPPHTKPPNPTGYLTKENGSRVKNLMPKSMNDASLLSISILHPQCHIFCFLNCVAHSSLPTANSSVCPYKMALLLLSNTHHDLVVISRLKPHMEQTWQHSHTTVAEQKREGNR